MLRYSLSLTALALAFSAAFASAAAQTMPATDSDYMARVAAAAPADVVKGATVVRMQADGSMKTLQTGTNGFTCMVAPPGEAMCLDANGMAWAKAYMSKGTPPATAGFVYMLAGDNGASNTDPYATGKTADNHWVVTGPHVMIVGPLVKGMGYPMAADANPSMPYVMWADTPYAHLMIPVSGQAPTPP